MTSHTQRTRKQQERRAWRSDYTTNRRRGPLATQIVAPRSFTEKHRTFPGARRPDGRLQSEARRWTLFALEFQQFLAEPFAAVLKDQQPSRHLLPRIAKAAVKHPFMPASVDMDRASGHVSPWVVGLAVLIL